MKAPRLKIILPIAILAIGGYLYWFSGATNEELIQKVFGDRELFNAFIGSQQVTAQRLQQRSQNEISPNELSNYSRGQTVTVSVSQARRLKRILQRSSSYYQGSMVKSCIPDYGVLITFRSGPRTIQVALCFKCSILGIFDGADDKARRVNSLYDFGPMRSDVASIVKKIFPDDAEIQDLE